MCGLINSKNVHMYVLMYAGTNTRLEIALFIRTRYNFTGIM